MKDTRQYVLEMGQTLNPKPKAIHLVSSNRILGTPFHCFQVDIETAEAVLEFLNNRLANLNARDKSQSATKRSKKKPGE